jgi:UDP-glucose 4-epimerase
MSKVLVTGGAGFVGSHIVDFFVARNDEVTVLDNLFSGKAENVNPGANFVKGDITDKAKVAEVMQQVDYVFHMAALVSVPLSFENPGLCQEINIVGTRNILESAKNHNVKKVVLASSAAVYGDNSNLPLKESETLRPQSPYAESKLANERMAREYSDKGLPVVSLRFFNIYGPRQDPKSPYSGVISIFVDKVQSDENITIFGDGTNTRDLVSVVDVVQANALAMDMDAGEYNVAAGSSISIRNVAALLIKLANSNSRLTFAQAREGDIKHSEANIAKIRRWGFSPSVDLEGGLKKLLA